MIHNEDDAKKKAPDEPTNIPVAPYTNSPISKKSSALTWRQEQSMPKLYVQHSGHRLEGRETVTSAAETAADSAPTSTTNGNAGGGDRDERDTTLTNGQGYGKKKSIVARDATLPSHSTDLHDALTVEQSLSTVDDRLNFQSADRPIVSTGEGISEWSHQQLSRHNASEVKQDASISHEDEWQEMPAIAEYDMYDDDGRLVARAAPKEEEDVAHYSTMGGAVKGYTRVQVDDDAQSATSMDDDTAYLFKNGTDHIADEFDDDARDPASQMQTTKNLFTDSQKIAYVGLVRLAMADMSKDLHKLERTRGAKKELDFSKEAMKMWSQKTMVNLYAHMELDPAEQIMIEQLAGHGLLPRDLTPQLMQNARIRNPLTDPLTESSAQSAVQFDQSGAEGEVQTAPRTSVEFKDSRQSYDDALPTYQEHPSKEDSSVTAPEDLQKSKDVDIDLRWTVLCDLFLILVANSNYDSRSRTLLERVGSFLEVDWIDLCRFEKRVTDALEMQEAAKKETWDEREHMENRRKMARNRRLAMIGLATVGGGLVIGLSAGLLAPVIGAGLAAGFTTIGVSGTGTFLAGAGGAAVVSTTGVLTGGTITAKAAGRRTGAVKTFEYRPLHNNKRVNLIVTVAGWMNGKVDDVRLPFSTVDPIMGDIYSVLWEPEMLTSMGDTINILATEALTQGLQQILGSTILVALMSSLQLPLVLTKLSYIIDNPWSVSQARADLAGLILADSLIDRNLGVRPITLIGFSLGSRVIFSCLRELSKKGAVGIVQNVYMFGSPVVVNKDQYIRARSVVSGRFVNGYATNDWILGYLFRATSGGIMRVAGLAPINIEGVENVDVTKLVPGHMAYRAAMPRVLREVGFAVESDDFAEIEDPDPDNHNTRQRELISEIEDARKAMKDKPQKKRFGFFGRSKKRGEKKEWETYDERPKTPGGEDDPDAMLAAANGVLFDIDALRKETVELASQGVDLKEIHSTMPPLRTMTSSTNLSSPISSSSSRPSLAYRETRSYDGGSTGVHNDQAAEYMRRFDYDYNESEHQSNGSGNHMKLSFDNDYHKPSSPSPHRSPAAGASPLAQSTLVPNHDDAGEVTMTFDSLHGRSPSTSPHRPKAGPSKLSRTALPRRSDMHDEDSGDLSKWRQEAMSEHSTTRVSHNAWAYQDDEFGQEKEVEMSFE